jgi:glyoxylase-like metal-dependent hydrolase (beta-lactamase superfamily II)
MTETAGSASARWVGGRLGPQIECVLAPNPGPMTLDGTNTWLLSAAGDQESVVVDPGPDDPAHLRSVLDAADRSGARIGTIVLTHRHPDHSAGARRLSELTAAPVLALDPAHRTGEPLTPGDRLERAGVRIEVLSAPGHTDDSLCFLLPDVGAVLTGDTVLGRGTSVIAHPEGRLGDYLATLDRLHAELAAGGYRMLLPGHGPALPDPQRVVAGYLEHRRGRLAQVRWALAAGADDARAVVEFVYPDVGPELRPAAERAVRAQLAYLAELGEF